MRPLYLAESDLYENGLPIFLSHGLEMVKLRVQRIAGAGGPGRTSTSILPNVVFGELLRSWTAVVRSEPAGRVLHLRVCVHHDDGRRTAAVYSALAYGLSEEMLEHLRHLDLVHAIAWLPLIVALARSSAGWRSTAPLDRHRGVRRRQLHSRRAPAACALRRVLRRGCTRSLDLVAGDRVLSDPGSSVGISSLSPRCSRSESSSPR